VGEIAIRALEASGALATDLAALLVEGVANGGSLSFMDPLDPQVALAFWERALADAERGGRIVLGAFDGEALVGTVSVLLDLPPNQPHRAEIGKMIVRVSHRGRGIAAALMRAAEAQAVARGRTLLVLDTAAIGGASGLYERLGFTYVGTIPDFALLPQGGLTGAMFYWKRIGG
jgi:ribosomal protein S18 acetylase RimI-like enzyme